MDKEPASRGWWQTIPGVLTAIAAVLTATAGLIAALHQAGFFPSSTDPTRTHPSGNATGSGPDKTQADSTDGAARPGADEEQHPAPAALTTGEEVRVDDAIYKILSMRVAPHSPGRLLLQLHVRMTNNDRYDANFWSRSFRLRVDGVPQAPANELNELVSSHAAKDATVEFVIPDKAADLGLQIGAFGEDAPTIALHPR